MLEKNYQFDTIEADLYKFWEQNGFFKPKGSGETYCITIPPPNVTGRLHMGHALNSTIQDVLIRTKRMQGYCTLWIPGVDHGGISTHSMVEKELAKEGLTRFKIGREEFEKRVWDWKNKYGDLIFDQLKQIGASCDWERSRFTMDQDYTNAVYESFLHYYKKGLIYQGERTVNWCPKCQTSISDLEIDYKEEKTNLWHIKYPVKDTDKFLTVATTRPETMFGDTAVAVNPKDKRYSDLVGKFVILPIVEKEIPIIADDFVDMEFGTGVVKITPAHDLNDYQSSQRNNLPIVSVIDEYGKLNENAPAEFVGLKTTEAREKVLEILKQKNLLEKINDYIHQAPYCSRCSRLIENIPSLQWFLKMDELAILAKEAVVSGKVKFNPKSWENTYLNWLDNVRDWCISRQLWWGHRMPVYINPNDKDLYVGKNPPEGYEQIPDVFDTWFSSALWPFAVLGWPNKESADLKKFYPTNVLSTARDIINLWVARMVYSSVELLNEIPFTDVIIHPTILAKDGRRMSKSLGTGIDPIDLITKYGADATRMGLMWQATELQDVKFSEDPIIAGKKFANKIWNASRFVMLDIPEGQEILLDEFNAQTDADKIILEKLNNIITSITQDIDEYHFAKAIRDFYEFFWHDFCDVYIEKAKEQKSENTTKILMHTLLTSLKLLHPFMPFVTESIYQQLPIKNKDKAIIISPWPKI
jgi:valyl-tRNA synthetase